MIERFNELIDIMNSKSPMNALWCKKKDDDSNNTTGEAVKCRYKRDKIQVQKYTRTLSPIALVRHKHV
jgi:hypothetical protein